MKNSAILVFASLSLTLSLIACGARTDSPYSSDTYFSSNIRLFDPNNLEKKPAAPDAAVVDFIKNQQIKKSDVMRSLRALQASFQTSYIGYDLKKDLIGKSSSKIFDSCENEVSQGPKEYSSIEYYDLVTRCLAKFQDTHLNISQMSRPPTIMTAVAEAVLIQDKLYIAQIRPNLIKRLEEIAKVAEGDFAKKLKSGFEIVSIDGNSPLSAINSLMPYVGASTTASRKTEAVENLFTRYNMHPKKSEVTLEVKNTEGQIEEIILPWLQFADKKNTQGSPESRTLLELQGLMRSTALSDDEKLTVRKGNTFDNVLYSDLTNKKTYVDEDGDDVLIIGIAKIDDRRACYVKLNTFSIDKDSTGQRMVYEEIGPHKNKRNFFEILKNFLGNCEVFSTPLVFDLRFNGGGVTRVADEIITLLTKTDAPKVYSAHAQLLTSGNFSMMSGLLNDIDSNGADVTTKINFKAAQSAISKNKKITDWSVFRSLKNELGVYSQKIVALISPKCISACEILTNHLKVSARAIVLGEPTSGTGFGFNSYGKGTTKFRDPLNFLEISIPNFSFQSVQIDHEIGFEKDEDTIAAVVPYSEIKIMENTPMVPDITVNYKLEDLTQDFSEYKKSVAEFLK